MTVEELNILISVSADEAISQIDAVIGRVAAVTQAADGAQITPKVIAKPATEQLAGLGSATAAAVTGAGEAVAQVTGTLEQIAPKVQTALDISQPVQKSAVELVLLGDAAQKTGAAVGDSFSSGAAAANVFAGTVTKVGGAVLQGLVAGGTQALVTLAISGVMSLVDALIHARENAEKAAAALRKQHQEEADALQKERAGLDTLADRYEVLAGKTNRTLDETGEMYQIQAQLREEYGITASTVQGLTGNYTSLAEAIKAAKEAQAAQSADALGKVADDAEGLAYNKSSKLYAQIEQQKANMQTDLADVMLTPAEISATKAAYAARIGDLEQQLSATTAEYTAFFAAKLDEAGAAVKAAGGQWNNDLALALASAFQIDPDQYADQEALSAAVYAAIDGVSAALQAPEVQDAFTAAEAFHAQIVAGVTPTEDDYNAVQEQYAVLRETIAGALSKITGSTVGTDSAQVAEMLAKLGVPEATLQSWKEFYKTWKNADLTKLNKQIDDVNASIKKQQTEAGNTRAIAEHVAAWKQALAVYQNTTAGSDAQRQAFARLQTEAAALGLTVVNSANSIATADKAVDGLAGGIDKWSSDAIQSLFSLQDTLAAVAANSVINGKVTMDTSPAISAINWLIEGWNKIRKLLGLKLISKISGGGRGGGSGSNSSDYDSSSSADTGPTLYEQAITTLEHYKELDRMTLEQELEYLKSINAQANAYAMTTEERLDIEERIYAVQKAILARDAEDLDTLANGVVDALQARYEAMRDTELDAIEQSRNAWEEWRDSNVAAIEDQIDALDALTESEDREADREEKLRKIASLQQQLAYEQDAYNRAKIQQQLTAAQDAYATWQTKIDREDQKAALEAQIAAINAQADSELAALEKQQKSVEAAYAARLETAALEAEAEKELMTSTQQEIIDLIAQYAPEYNATGETLGEQLLAGFQSKVGNIANWFASFNAMVENAQNVLAAQAQTAADAFYQSSAASGSVSKSVSITNENQFYVPVESPADTARRIRQANEELALQILAGN